MADPSSDDDHEYHSHDSPEGILSDILAFTHHRQHVQEDIHCAEYSHAYLDEVVERADIEGGSDEDDGVE